MKPVKLPQIIAVGPQRTGTTWLYNALKDQVGMPNGVKELFFFDRRFKKGLQWYSSHFLDCKSTMPIVEISPTYFHSDEARDRIYKTIPDCKIICSLRDPVERAYSVYKLLRIYGKTNLSFEEAFQNITLLSESSDYFTHIQEWQKVFGKKNVLVTIFDDLKVDPNSYIGNICKFIGIKPIFLNPQKRQPPKPEHLSWNSHLARLGEYLGHVLRDNQAYLLLDFVKKLGLRKLFFEGGGQMPEIEPEIEMKFRMHFTPEIQKIETLLQRDLSSWMQTNKDKGPDLTDNLMYPKKAN